MTILNSSSSFDLFQQPNFLDKQTCDQVIAEMQSIEGSPTTVYGKSSSGAVDERMRKAVRHMPAPETVELVRRKLLTSKDEIERHFSVSLNDCEEPQFLRYRVGDFFVAHQDGNTGLIRLEQENRRVSVVIFLNRQSEAFENGAYSGGSLTFHEWRPGPNSGQRLEFAGDKGTLVAFRAETTHEVTPVTHGERYSIACWYT